MTIAAHIIYIVFIISATLAIRSWFEPKPYKGEVWKPKVKG